MIKIELSMKQAERLLELIRGNEFFHEIVFELESDLSYEYESERKTKQNEDERQEALRSWFDDDDGEREQEALDAEKQESRV